MGSSSSTPTGSREPKVDPYLLNKKLHFLIIGKTGNGKSASCNAIAGAPEESPIFVSYNSSTAVTKTVCNYRIERWGKEISVTDTPGLEDTELDVIGNVRFAKKNMINAMEICPEGFHAIGIVLSYQEKFSAEDQRVIEVLTEIFSEDMFQFTVLIFTHGDVFDKNKGIKNVSDSQKMFKTWCQQQTGNLKSLLENCNFRAVLFHNSKKYEEERDVDMIELKRQTESIIQKGKLYTKVQFQSNTFRRDLILLNKFLDELKNNINKSFMALKKEQGLITRQEKKMIERIDDVLSNKTSNLPDLQELFKDLDEMKKKLKEKMKMKNKDRFQLYTTVQEKLDTELFLSLKLLSEDLIKVTKPEWHKEDLKHRAMALKNYITEEDYRTGKLRDEMEQINYFLSELNDLDKKGKGVFTEMK